MTRLCPLAGAVLLLACHESTEPADSPELARRGGTSVAVTYLNLSPTRGASRANAIDDEGRVAGSRGTTVYEGRAFLWTPGSPRGTTGTTIDLGDLGGGTAEAWAIDNSGHVVGSSTTSAAAPRPFLWENGTMHELPVPAGYDRGDARDVNDGSTRLAVGGVISPDDRALVWTVSGSGTGFQAAMEELPRLSSGGAFAFGVSDNDLVVGYSNNSTDNLPVSWIRAGAGWTVSALALLPGAGAGIARDANGAGTIVGFNRTSNSACDGVPAVWTSGGSTVTQLPALGGSCGDAWTINESGQIAGFAADRRGGQHAVLWRPTVSGYAVTDLGPAGGVRVGLNSPSAGGTSVEIVGTSFSKGSTRATLWAVP
jgi:probable HAF family extracellular repeat protein